MTREKIDRITINPLIQAGKAVIKGTRITVDFLIDLIRNNWSLNQLLENYPSLKQEDIIAAIDYTIQQYSEIIKDILQEWNEISEENFLQKAKNGDHEDAENDAICMKQCLLEKDRLLQKREVFV
ncbi:MAG: DUF433 domain-containing protein [Asgard group archaeon]|nr:DUF433 domain-containing protein [Asgard group archaeon]